MLLAAEVAYDGTDFDGFQRQAAGRTVQGELERGLAELWGQRITVHGAGRTDAGVHARGQVIAWWAAPRMPTERVVLAVRGHLPRDVSIRRVWEPPPGFDPRRHATSRVYRYSLVEDRVPHPLRDRYVTRVAPGLDRAAMAAAARRLEGEHEFASFCCENGYDGPTRRCVRRWEWSTTGDVLTAEIEGDSFLYKQVRCMMGVLLAIGRGRHRVDLVDAMLAGAPRPVAVAVAPPTGLVLERVIYEPRAGWNDRG